VSWSHPIVAAFLAAALVVALLGRAATIVHRSARRPAPRHPSTAGPPRRAWAIAGRGRRIVGNRLRRPPRPPSAEDVAAWCDELSRSLRSGMTLRDALVRSSSPTPSLDELIDRLRLRLERGAPIGQALADATANGRRRRTIPLRRGDDAAVGHLALAVAVIQTSASLGGANAQALDRAAAALRLRAADREERAAHSAQARMSAHVLTLVPLGFLALMVTIDPGVRGAIASPTGAAIVAIGLLLNGLGWLWMRTVIGGAG
jgi:Flp pilus assembly protein TadB